MGGERGDILCLSGPQHFDEKRPWTFSLRKYAEHLDPLGIAIVSTQLKQEGFNTRWMEMHPDKLNEVTRELGRFDAVCISARYYDTKLALEVVDSAEKAHVPTIVGGYSPAFNPELYQKATTIVVGEFEPVSSKVIADLALGKLDHLYDSRVLPPMIFTIHTFGRIEVFFPI